MLNGTMIDELLQIVERAEEHARVMELKEAAMKPVDAMMPGFLYEIQQQQQVMYGVA